MRLNPPFALFVLALAVASGPLGAQGFKFSQPDTSGEAEEAAKQERIIQQISDAREHGDLSENAAQCEDPEIYG